MACQAFAVRVQENALMLRGTTSLPEYCTKPDQAMPRLAKGETVTVQASAITDLRVLLRKQGVLVDIPMQA